MIDVREGSIEGNKDLVCWEGWRVLVSSWRRQRHRHI